MQVEYTPHFKRKFAKLSDVVQSKFEKKITLLLRNIRHPSLHAKKFDEAGDIWQARVDDNARFYFKITRNTYSLLDIKKHKD
ncbi:MAG: hypothetical protein G01um101430_484 [Parcubacteria group bacterium Gr01-1014_30]|nr:MAG: hypothetical protein G01um101430_484 [Parcubacteria group bacterium Gr01-1014_30]